MAKMKVYDLNNDKDIQALKKNVIKNIEVKPRDGAKFFISKTHLIIQSPPFFGKISYIPLTKIEIVDN